MEDRNYGAIKKGQHEPHPFWAKLIRLCQIVAKLSMILDVPLISFILFLYIFFFWCKLGNHWTWMISSYWNEQASQQIFDNSTSLFLNTKSGDDLSLSFFYYKCETAQDCLNAYDQNYQYLLSYVNNLMILMTVDLGVLIGKTFYAAQVLLHSFRNEDAKERKHYNKYFILAIIYYCSALLKYTLIEVAFTSGSQVVKNRVVTILLSTAVIGVGVYIPCLVIALRVADKQRA